jgi:hypothetical protein
MPRLPRRATVAFGLAAVLCAGIARASSAGAGPRFRSPAAGSRLEPGMSLRVMWDRPPARIGEREVELLFSADGGRSFPLRITGDLSADAGQYLWRVPTLPTAHARLALRAGDDGEPGEERIVFVSEEFSIESGTSWGAETLCRSGAEWRTEEAARGNPARPLTSALRTDSPESLRAIADSFPAADRRPAPAHPIRSHAQETRGLDFAAPPTD